MKNKDKAMVTVIKKGSSPQKVLEEYEKHLESKMDTSFRQLCGSMKLKIDPLELQKVWRDEWK
jgi:hypothetical protein